MLRNKLASSDGHFTSAKARAWARTKIERLIDDDLKGNVEVAARLTYFLAQHDHQAQAQPSGKNGHSRIQPNRA